MVYIYPKLLFQITLTEKDTLYRIKKFLESNEIKSSIYPMKRRNLRHKNQWILAVTDKSSLRKLIDLLTGLEWNSHKYFSFKLWEEAEKFVYSRPLSKENLMKIAGISIEMNDTNSGAKRKWTPEFIEQNCIDDGLRVKLLTL